MPLLTLLPAEGTHELAELIAPAWVFPAIAAAVFIVLGFVTWSYRDVYHRHADKTSGAAGGHQDAHH